MPFLRPLAAILVVCTTLLAGPAESLWIDVPFVRQERNGCGAACVAMIMEYWHKAGDSAGFAKPGQIYRDLYRPSARGVYASQMEAYFRKHGFRTFAFRGTWNELRHHISKGRPLIVCLSEGRRGEPLHYVVVAGLNVANQTILVNDPARRKLLAMDRADFQKRWAAEADWTLLAVPR